ncbi:MAG: hypothetical protein R2799_10640 [Crocinitomicaceae bacterium]
MRGILLVAVLLIFSSILGQSTARIEGAVYSEGIPLSDVNVFQVGTSNSTITNAAGYFALEVEAGKKITIRISYLQKSREMEIKKLRPDEVLELGKLNIGSFTLNAAEVVSDTGDVEKKRPNDFLSKIPKIDYGKIAQPTDVFEKTLAYTTVAVSNNELTANYNVRGGNFDENLIYVNDIQIYRPFLIRSGQQEGLSFINSDLVEDVGFSGGGWEARFGDKLSSVLDIKYTKPKIFKASAMASFMGVKSHIEGSFKKNIATFLIGARYRANGYLLNALPTEGEYLPRFFDVQGLFDFNISEKITFTILGHFSSNLYHFIPQTRETTFGTVNQALALKVYFDGQEKDQYKTGTGAINLNWNVNKNLSLKFYATSFVTDETEYYDIQGQYFINELETNAGSDNYGDSINNIGVGTYLEHGRNDLTAFINSVYHKGSYNFTSDNENKSLNRIFVDWGVKYEHDEFKDNLSEWLMQDSSGFSLPYDPNKIELNNILKANNQITSNRYTGYAQSSFEFFFKKDTVPLKFKKKVFLNDTVKTIETFYDTAFNSNSKLVLNIGLRGGYLDVNNEGWLTPRMVLSYFPRSYLYENGRLKRRLVELRFGTGLYYQPPFYREFRRLDGTLNTNVKAQKSFHAVMGADIYFSMWSRKSPFKFTVEAYYKYIWDLNPYQIQEVQIEYLAHNDARAYAYGIDFKVNGEFIPGIQSFLKMGFMQTKEDILTDSYIRYFDGNNQEVFDPSLAVSQDTVQPGYIPRPTDQLFNIGVLFQDQMPKVEALSASLSLLFGSRLPFGPPNSQRYQDTLRSPSYFRVDLGIAYNFMYNKPRVKKFWRAFSDITLSFEIFNLFGKNNVISYTWVQDINARSYAIPNHLTNRRFNLKLQFRFDTSRNKNPIPEKVKKKRD